MRISPSQCDVLNSVSLNPYGVSLIEVGADQSPYQLGWAGLGCAVVITSGGLPGSVRIDRHTELDAPRSPGGYRDPLKTPEWQKIKNCETDREEGVLSGRWTLSSTDGAGP